MEIKRVHFLRELLVSDYRGKSIPTMEYSYDNASYLKPTFQTVASGDTAQARALYLKLGGSRPESGGDGTTVIIPNRSWFANWSAVSPEEVKIVATKRS